MPDITERRLFPRYPAVDLVADINGRLFDVADISLGGIRLRERVGTDEGTVTFLLCSCDGGVIDRKRGVEVSARVVGCHDGATALEFLCATMPLMKLVVRQASLELGVEPYAVK